MKNPYQQIGKQIRLIRRQAGLTQAELAEKASLSDNFVGLIERGEGRPTIQAVDRIADALGVHLSELFLGNADEPKNAEETLQELRQVLKQREPKNAQLILSISKRIFECFPIKGKGNR